MHQHWLSFLTDRWTNLTSENFHKVQSSLNHSIHSIGIQMRYNFHFSGGDIELKLIEERERESMHMHIIQSEYVFDL